MSRQGEFGHIDTWIFDLDNTLYPSQCRLFDQIDVKMGEFISSLLNVDQQEAKRIQKNYYLNHGTTLRGLMTEHGASPEAFLDYVHDIDYSPVPADERLDVAIENLPGRKLIFTNGTVAHAESVLERIGISAHFDAIFDIKAADHVPKPEMIAYETLLESAQIEPKTSAMFEDLTRNLEAPHVLGMTTVLVYDPENKDAELVNRAHSQINGDTHIAEHIHHVTYDLAGFLEGIRTLPVNLAVLD